MPHLIGGLVAVALGALGIIAWWQSFGEVLRGLLPLLFVVGGLAAVAASFQKAAPEPDESGPEAPAADGGRPSTGQ